jgi:hypothetical protein
MRRRKITKIFVAQLLLAGACDCVGSGVGTCGAIVLGAWYLNL